MRQHGGGRTRTSDPRPRLLLKVRARVTSRTHSTTLWRCLIAEYVGSLFLAAVVIGSGIAAQTLSPHAKGIELFENAAATAAGLFVIILMFGAISGAHFNPVVSFVDAALNGISWTRAMWYCVTQILGCVSGAVVANLMFSRAVVSISTHARATPAHAFSEVVATIGLIILIFALHRTGRGSATPAAVGAYIGSAYFFTSSTSFANPAIAVGRMLSNSFAGIDPSSVPTFVGAEIVGGALAFLLIRVLYPETTKDIHVREIAAEANPAVEPDPI